MQLRCEKTPFGWEQMAGLGGGRARLKACRALQRESPRVDPPTTTTPNTPQPPPPYSKSMKIKARREDE